MMAVAALCNLAGIRMLHGQLYGARDAYRHALTLSTTATGQRLPVAARALLGLGELSREWNNLDTAEQQLSEAALLAEQYGEMGGLISDLTLSRVKLAQGDPATAEALLASAAKRASASRITQLDDRLVALACARSAILRKQQTPFRTPGINNLPPAATAWLSERESTVRHQIFNQCESTTSHRDYNMVEAEAIVLARIYLERGEPTAALSLIAPLVETARREGRKRRLIELLVLEARAHQAVQQEPAALEVLLDALKLAAPEGYVRTFVDEGVPLCELLQRLHLDASRGGSLQLATSLATYTTKLLAQFDASLQPVQQEPVPQPAVLSAREVEVLELIAAGYTNREIGQKLFIALDTVKGHTRKIYSKLDVNSRTQAVAKARDAGILPQD